MRVSSDGDRQVLDLHRDALLAAGVDARHLFDDRASGSRDDRAGLAAALAFLRPGGCLVVWKLDRLGRSLPHLLTVVTDIKPCGGDASEGTPRWQSNWTEPLGRPTAERRLPVQWPDSIPSARDYPFGAGQFGTNGPNQTMNPRQREAATLERLRDLPTGEWSDADVRAVIGSQP